ncbi:MAG: flagellar motor switch phosphatase FliY [Lachnospiraceae bacterium]|nr:flagellar motor switch phosphatase FliY [Lachnospiraceae bacterium]
MDGGMLSQDEINALLSGMDLSEPPADASAEAAEPAADGGSAVDESLLTDVERDAVGEVANISMGSSATTLYSLVNRKVDITTPVVTLTNWEGVLADYVKPCVFIQIKYTQGLDGSNILVLHEDDVKVITDLMMGGDGTNTDGELGELHLSAISEAMNQMMGSAATSLSTMLGIMIDISPPQASQVDLTAFSNGSDIAEFLGGTFVKVAFRMQIGDNLVNSTIMQLYPVDFAKEIVDTFINQQMGGSSAPEPEPEPVAPSAPQSAAAPMDGGAGQMGMPQMDMSQMGMPGMGMPQMGMPQMGMPGMAMPQMGMPQMYMPPQMSMQPNVNVQPAQFQSFSNDLGVVNGQENIGLIMDVPLEVTVELGRTSKSISEILDFAPGTIIELDRIAGEPIDVLVNGKFVARGEVVVIEESFGIRVTEIIK